MAPKSPTKIKTPTKRGATKSQATDLNLLFLWTYLQNNKGTKLNHKEVAQQLGMTTEAAKSRYHSLKKYFNSMEADNENRAQGATITPTKKQAESQDYGAKEQAENAMEDIDDEA